MEYKMNLNPRAFKAIQNQTKKVEIRANKNDSIIKEMKPFDILFFKNLENNEMIKCIIKKITLYKNVKDLLLNEGIEKCISSCHDLENSIKSIESIPGYKNIIEMNGVFAIEIY